MKELKDCFHSSVKDEEKGKKHKGLLIIKPDIEKAKDYLKKAKKNIELILLYKKEGFDYKIPEEWFYTLYYCALAILSKIGIETRSQRCTALLLKYLKEKNIINYEDKFIDKIMVYKEKEQKTFVDEREHSRYSSLIKIEEVSQIFEEMNQLCLNAINQTEDLIYSKEEINLPEEIKILIN